MQSSAEQRQRIPWADGATNDWPIMSLREAGVTLIDCDHRTPPPADGGYPYIAIPQLKEGRLDLSDVRRISPGHFVDWTRKAKPQHHDVILSRRCNPGETAHVPSGIECALGQNLVLLRSDGTKLFPPFLRWLVRGPDWWEQVGAFINVGAVFDSLKCADIPNFRILLPPLPEQKAIAQILGSLDDKIELNRRMNETLEGMARALFKSWFVDFDPVRAKLDGRPPPNLDPTTAALFPDHFEHTESGLLPVGWKEVTVDDVVDDVYDGPHATPPPADEGAVFLGIDNLTGTQIDLSSIRFIGEAEWPRWTKRVTPRENDIVFTYEATLGYFALIPPGLRCCLGRRLALIRPRSSDPHPYFLFHWFTSAPFLAVVFSHCVHGSTVDRVPLLDFPKYPVIWPPTALIGRFEQIAQPIWAKIHTIQAQSRTLAALRDALLPKLLSGEIRIPTAEKLVEEVA